MMETHGLTYLLRSYCTSPSGVLMFPVIFGTVKVLSSFATNGRIVCSTVLEEGKRF